jgi:flavin reductase (DIM6/NTAB) family NADH-FMN oxidoreductase RutF
MADCHVKTGIIMAFYFYETAVGHNLPHDPLKAIIAPRPIGWISTLNARGQPNLAPYSFFNMVCGAPPIVAFSSTGFKHSAANAQATGEFVVNLATLPLLQAVSATSAPVAEGVNEFDIAGLEAAPCRSVKAPRVGLSPAALECKLISISELRDMNEKPTDSYLVLGQVVGVHIDEAYLKAGLFDTAAAQPLMRAGYMDYSAATQVFQLARPGL